MRIRVLVGTVVAAATALASIAYAQTVSDPIAVRKGIMQSNGASVGIINAMLQPGAAYDAAAATAALTTIAGNMVRFPMLFPEGSQTGGTPATRALPAIWANLADVQARAAKLSTDAATAANAAADGVESLRAAFAEVSPNCGGCHQLYRGPAA
ncbi:MAG: cytochrome c [Bauldia sp.]|nr:cytochrome c [Bauldia sp.]